MEFSHFLSKFEENIVFYRGKWAPRADSIVFYKEFARPEGQENPGQCGQNPRKTMIFVFFFAWAWKMHCGDVERSKASTWGRKSGSEAMKIWSWKRGSEGGGLEICIFRKMGRQPLCPPGGRPPGRGVGGRDKSLPKGYIYIYIFIEYDYVIIMTLNHLAAGLVG